MRRTLIATLVAGLFIDATVFTASQASRMTDGAQLLAAMLLGAAGLVAVFAAVGYGFGAAWQAGSAAVYARRLERRQQPVEPVAAPPSEQALPVGYTPSAMFDEYWAEARYAVAAAEGGDYRAYEARHVAPLARTLLLPVVETGVDLAAWGVHKVGGVR